MGVAKSLYITDDEGMLEVELFHRRDKGLDNGATVTCAKGMRIITDMPVAEMGEVDVLLLSGGRGRHALA